MKIKKIGFLSIALLFVLIGCFSLHKKSTPFDSSILTTIYLTFNEEEAPLTLDKLNAQTTSDFLFFAQLIEDFELAQINQVDQEKQSLNQNPLFVTVKTQDLDGLISLYEIYLQKEDDSLSVIKEEKQVDFSIETLTAFTKTNSFLSHYQHFTPLSPELILDDSILPITTSFTLLQQVSKNIQIPIESSQEVNSQSEVDLTGKEIQFNNSSSFSSTNTSYSIQHLSSDEVTLLLEESLSTNGITLPTQNGHYKLEIHQEINESSLSGQISHSLLFTINNPPTFSILNEYIEPGDLLVLEGKHLDQNTNYQIDVDLYHDGSGFIPYEDRFIAFLPITSKSAPGEYLLTVRTPDTSKTVELTFQIHEKEFPIQQLTTSSSTASIQNENNYALMEEAFERGRMSLHEEPLWDGPFLQPAEGRISTEYGVIRFTNGSESNSRHSGIDFANPLGTPTYATQNGYITLSEMINVTGNTVFIDHGFQIISQYYHLETIAVEVGDYVKKGDLIGTIGSTGFSTGPHLHFSIYSHGVYVNPWKFFEKAPF